MTIELQEIDGLEPKYETRWKIRALVIDGKNPVKAALVRWEKEREQDFKKIMKVMRLAAQQDKVRNPTHVKKSTNPAHGNAYEMLAYSDVARLMFFYDETEESVIVCTNEFEKSRGNQSAAFERCVILRDFYLKNYFRNIGPNR